MRIGMTLALAATLAVPAYALTPPARAAKAAGPEQLAQAAVERWLALLDQSRYGDLWDQSSKLFRDSTPRAAFAQGAAGLHGRLGKVLSRKLVSHEIMDRPQGLPDGKYVVFHYATQFEHKKDATETVTPTLDADGLWRVAGYAIPNLDR